jgi:Patatin-like phospholipase
MSIKIKKTYLVILVLVLSGCASNQNREALSKILGPKSSDGAGSIQVIDSKLLTESKCLVGDKGCRVDRLLRASYCHEHFLKQGKDTSAAVVSNKREKNTDSELVKEYETCLTSKDREFKRDQLSLALSGGGTRSASFSMGVLKALHDTGHLDKMDALSSVSGGGYTAYWYYMQRYYQYINYKENSAGSGYYQEILTAMDEYEGDLVSHPLCMAIDSTEKGKRSPPNHTVDDMFRRSLESPVANPARFQSHIESQSDIINYSTNSFGQKIETGGLLATHFLTLPIYWVTDGIFKSGAFNGSVETNNYRKGLERTYGMVPNTDRALKADYTYEEPDLYRNSKNGAFLRWKKNARVDEIKMEDLKSFQLAYNQCAFALSEIPGKQVPPMPMPIINTKLTRPASFFGNDKHDDYLSLEKSVFSFTPIHWGSEYTGYFNTEELHTPTFISKLYATSGAAVDKGARESGFWGTVGLDLFNLNLGYNIRNPRYQKDGWGTAWFLSHKVVGGFPLGYLIPEKSKATLHLSDGGHAENLGLYSLIKRGTRRIVVVDGEHDPTCSFDAYNRIKDKLASEANITLTSLKDRKGRIVAAGQYCMNMAEDPVLTATVEGMLDSAGDTLKMDIIYVKLSLDQRLVAPIIAEKKDMKSCWDDARRSSLRGDEGKVYPCSVSEYYKSEEHKEGSRFPMNSTADVWYSKEQYRAYRDLGYYIGMNELKPILDKIVD